MKNEFKIKNNFPPKVSSIIGYIKFTKHRFLILLCSIKLHHPSRLIKYRMINLLTFALIYPLIRFIVGSKKAHDICNSFEGLFCPSGVLHLPFSLQSKIIIPKHIACCYLPYLEIYLANVYHMERLKKGMNVIDIGAHIGVYTVLAAEKVGKKGEVIAIEPEPKNYKQLLENIKLNNFQNVIPRNLALANHESLGKLYLSSDSLSYSLLSCENKNPYLEVAVKTLDNLLEEINLKKVDIIKIDTEGSEIPILKGAEKTLKANPNAKIIVASYHYPSEIKEVCQFLNERGFKTKVSKENIVTTI